MIKHKGLTLFFCLFFLMEFSSSCAEDWKRVYLTSYPRSGNHWIRYLVEEASHIATASVYHDKEPLHMKKVFPWGGYCCDHGYEGNCRYPNKNDLVLIKTHFPSQPDKVTDFDRLPYKMAIRIVRHPVDSFYSRYVRRPEGPLQETVPTDRVERFIKSWRQFQAYWNKRPNVLTIRYEDLLDNPFVELKKILEVLQYQISDEDIARAVMQHPPQGFMLKSQNKFTDADLKLIDEKLEDLMAQFGYKAASN